MDAVTEGGNAQDGELQETKQREDGEDEERRGQGHSCYKEVTMKDVASVRPRGE